MKEREVGGSAVRRNCEVVDVVFDGQWEAMHSRWRAHWWWCGGVERRVRKDFVIFVVFVL